FGINGSRCFVLYTRCTRFLTRDWDTAFAFGLCRPYRACHYSVRQPRALPWAGLLQPLRGKRLRRVRGVIEVHGTGDDLAHLISNILLAPCASDGIAVPD